ncbi:MAG: hypothetical protein LGB03_00770 [Sulfurovum sp.]|nr:hypothetical protein [Sulfurovum sp.]
MKKSIALLLMLMGMLQASGLGFNINNKDLEFEGNIDMGYKGSTKYSINAIYLRTTRSLNYEDIDDSKVGDYLDDLIHRKIGLGSQVVDDLTKTLLLVHDNFGSISFNASNKLSSASGVVLTFGIGAVFERRFTRKYVATPVSGKVTLHLPFDGSVPPLTLSTKISYAPSVLSFFNAKQYLEYRFEADMEVIPDVHVYGGHKNIDTTYKTIDNTIYLTYTYNLVNDWYGGIRITF